MEGSDNEYKPKQCRGGHFVNSFFYSFMFFKIILTIVFSYNNGKRPKKCVV